MKPDRATQQAMALMAAGTLDERTRKRLEALIADDPDHRTYWNEISRIATHLESEQRAADAIGVPSDFHDKLETRLVRFNANESPSRPQPRFVLRWGFGLSALAAIILLLVHFSHPSIQKPSPPLQALAPEPALQMQSFREPHSVMDYMTAVSKSDDSLDELFRRELIRGFQSSREHQPIVKMGDRTLPDSE